MAMSIQPYRSKQFINWNVIRDICLWYAEVGIYDTGNVKSSLIIPCGLELHNFTMKQRENFSFIRHLLFSRLCMPDISCVHLTCALTPRVVHYLSLLEVDHVANF